MQDTIKHENNSGNNSHAAGLQTLAKGEDREVLIMVINKRFFV